MYRGNYENYNENIFLEKLKEWEVIPKKFDILEKNEVLLLKKDNKLYTTSIKKIC